MLQPKFSAVVNDDDNRDILPVIATQCKKVRVFRQSLNFKKVGLGSCADNIQRFNRDTPPTNIPYIFDNCIRTDGHIIEFLFGKKKSAFELLLDLTMSDLADLDLEDLQVYGVDPGHNHLVTAVDIEGYFGTQENKNCIRFPNNEWYAKAGAIFRYKEQQKMKESVPLNLRYLPKKLPIQTPLLIRANIGLIILEGQAPFMAFTLQTTDF
jgi:hypothetical protein